MLNKQTIESRPGYRNDEFKTAYYRTKFFEGRDYQDFVSYELYKRGIILMDFSGRYFQKNLGENLMGVEIKRDGRFRSTGNLFIEIAEKAHPNNPNYVASGIYKDDNSWLYIIGDEKTIYIFPVKYLRMLRGKYPEKEIATSRGFIMPIADAEKWNIKKIQIGNEMEHKSGPWCVTGKPEGINCKTT